MSEKATQRISTGDARGASRLAISVLALCALLPGFALGHVESGVAGDGGFVSGLVHPVTGPDHVVAMVAANARPPLAIAFLLVAFFAIYHGHPHGAALPDFGVPILYAAGFVVATGLLHVAGIAFGLLYRWPAGKTAVRALGAGIAAVGGYFLLLAIGSGTLTGLDAGNAAIGDAAAGFASAVGFISSAICFYLPAALIASRYPHGWQRIAMRIVASWVAAIATIDIAFMIGRSG